MPILGREKHKLLSEALYDRFQTLKWHLEPRPLISAKEGAGRGRWGKPEEMCATQGNATEIRLAIDDFKTILAELRRLA